MPGAEWGLSGLSFTYPGFQVGPQLYGAEGNLITVFKAAAQALSSLGLLSLVLMRMSERRKFIAGVFAGKWAERGL